MVQFPQPRLVTSTNLPAQITLPDIPAYTSKVFALKHNPHHLQAAHEAYESFDSYSIHTGSKRQRFFDYDFGLMSALCFADADFPHLRTAIELVLWLFSFDDMIDRGALNSIQAMQHAVNVTMKVLRDPSTPPPRFKVAAVLQSCFNRMRQDGGSGTLQRFIDATDQYTQRSLKQQINKSTERIPTVEEYIQHRREASAMMTALAVLEYTLELNLPDEVANDPAVIELGIVGSDILNWANDIYSFPVEFARGDVHNFVSVAMEHMNLGVEEAIAYVNQRIQKRVDEYVVTKNKLPKFGPGMDEQAARYIQGIEYFVQGFIDWSFITPRYFGDEAKKVKETGIVKLVAPIALDAPLRVEA
ncbi:Alpha-muurolene synthase OS=Coprinopsis cinerea (strain Okayama-7 / 130 / ATCC MYA-4618 / FGSC 9003) GN=COP3 PE=1 SV=1 [Rhizoctonia solani AG-1 IB]|uniref:Terpene synthase n=1 Tax=Thanatephorus cucumeris (strain AG1-IB / isolate 7/3/14) TaxID=1108050 RepID=A0A0B7FJJ6_THACB|nr:Alpha-muurolene synthase OS=Coprinopsis cinerea (strain Okayama-7 / 130 / ATCC MYA-4618 / FGSC 9003) GN=COP3 PE=1 SV=1 [Rhizoctonia solani AG-1 IB]